MCSCWRPGPRPSTLLDQVTPRVRDERERRAALAFGCDADVVAKPFTSFAVYFLVNSAPIGPATAAAGYRKPASDIFLRAIALTPASWFWSCL